MNTDSVHFLAKRNEFASSRLNDLKKLLDERLSPILNNYDTESLCLYVTGSYGRREASESSDLDIFFIENNREANHRNITNIDITRVKAEVIRISEEMIFPAFSNDGQYLEMHSLKDILDVLGGREDDFKNYFTARVLLLLESYPVYDKDGRAYQVTLDNVIESYYRDYHDHETDFRPLFLINDILRFWKTLCLNYENKRNWKTEDEVANRKHHLNNLKLKFSRLLTCFSMVIPLAKNTPVSPEAVVELVKQKPLERLSSLIEDDPENEKARQSYEKVVDMYVWFLNEVKDPDEIRSNLGHKEYRNIVFNQGREFSKELYNLLRSSVDDEALRYITM
jgi:predicted nucleotidyltransferase